MRVSAACLLALSASAVRLELGEELGEASLAESEEERPSRRERRERRRERKGCPGGLTRESPRSREYKYCKQDDPEVWEGADEAGFEMDWEVPDPEPPLYFRKQGGSFMLEHHFIQELMLATGDVGVSHKIYNDFIEDEEAVNTNFAEESSAFIGAVKKLGEDAKTLYEGGVVKSNETLELASKTFNSVKKLMEDAGGVIDGVKVKEALVKATFNKVNGSAHSVIGWSEDQFDKIYPVLAVGFALENLWREQKQLYKEKSEHVDSYVTKLTKRSTCVGRQTKLQQVAATESDFLKADVYQKCGDLNSQMLSRQMFRTNAAFNHLFEVMAATGQCMWPSGTKKQKNNRVRCADALYTPLREVRGGEKGVLFEAISFAAVYADAADELLGSPVYNGLVHRKFDIEAGSDSLHQMNPLWNVDASEKAEVRSEACLSVVATQRAFERTFIKLAAAIPVYLQTYGRKMTKIGLHANWRPCTKVFNALDDDSGEGMCRPIKDGTYWRGLLHERRDDTVDVDDACDEEDEEASMSLWPRQTAP